MKAGGYRHLVHALPAFCWLVALMITWSSNALADDTHTPLEPIPCPGEAIEGEQVVCFILHVPADWNDLSGRTMELPVMRFAPANDGPVNKPPLLMLGGGPGQGVVPVHRQILSNLKFLRGDRELILMDQRGTGPLAQQVQCGEAIGDDDQIEVEKVVDCVKRAEKNGQFLADYSTDFAVQDYRALRYALKIKDWAIIGNSYGARVAQGLIREDEEGVERVLFNGPLFLGTRFFDWNPLQKIEAAIELCNEQEACRSAYPDLYWDFKRLSFDMRQVKYAGDDKDGNLQAFLYRMRLQALLADHDLKKLPADIEKTAKSLQKAIKDNIAWTPPPPLPASMKGLGLLMHFAILCAEDIEPLEGRSLLEFDQPLLINFYRTACEEIAKASDSKVSLSEGWDKAAKTDKPVLIINGEFDTIVDPSAAEKVLALYPNASLITIPNAGHDVLSQIPCAREMAHEFLSGKVEGSINNTCQIETPKFD